MSSVTTVPQLPNNNVPAGQSQYQDQLADFCRGRGVRPPSFQIVSDRRGGRTAWSCVVSVQGFAPCPARFWYDGQYVNNAREDAAEKALQVFGILPTPPGIPQHLRAQQQQDQQQ